MGNHQDCCSKSIALTSLSKTCRKTACPELEEKSPWIGNACLVRGVYPLVRFKELEERRKHAADITDTELCSVNVGGQCPGNGEQARSKADKCINCAEFKRTPAWALNCGAAFQLS